MTTTASTPRRSTTRTREIILTALGEATEPVTVTELAELAGVGKSTLAKHLPALEKDELVVRTPGGRDGRRRLPDTWQAATSTAPDTTLDEDTSAKEHDHAESVLETVYTETDIAPDTTADDVPEADAPVPTLATQDTSPQEPCDQAQVEDTATVSAQNVPAQDTLALPAALALPRRGSVSVNTVRATSVQVEAAVTEERNPVSGSTRLAPGELKLMVKAILDASPEEEFTATAISHLLQGRSIGAIQNNLARLAKEGKAVQTCDRPRRYRSAQHPA